MKKKWKLILSIFGIVSVATATAIPITYTVIKNNNDYKNNSNNNNNNNSSNNDNSSDNNDIYDGTDKVTYTNKVKPYTDGRHAFSTYNASTNSINYSIGPTGVTPSPGVEKKATISTNYLYNDTQVKQAKRTIGVSFYSNGNANINSGTSWILDYKIPDNKDSYPLTWYLATNAHVVQNLKVANDIITPERYEGGNSHDTTRVVFTTPKEFTLDKNLWDSLNTTEFIPSTTNGISNIRTVFIGNDFLKTSPKMYSKTERWQKYEEYADFAVMEVTFQNEQQAKTVTMDYANKTDNQFKYKKESLLAHQEKVKKNNYSIVGYPAWKNNIYASNISVSQKADPKTSEEKNKLSSLATSPFYNSYQDKSGVFDAAISLSFMGYSYRKNLTTYDEDFFLSWGLMYPIDYGSLTSGSSGSMTMDADGYTIGIHFAMDPDASIGLTQALYCEGFDYQGAFGKYNLEGYDLIDGGFQNQKKSYKDGLKQLYGNNNLKTNLYKNGINNPMTF